MNRNHGWERSYRGWIGHIFLKGPLNMVTNDVGT